MWCFKFLFYVCFILNECYYNEAIHSIFQQNPDIQIGSNCTWNELSGTCTSLVDCPSAQDAINKRHYPTICSFEGLMPIVCCTAPEITQKNSEVSDNSSLSSELKPGTKAKEQCLKYLKTLDYTCPMARDSFLRGGDSTEDDEAITPSADLDSPVTDPSTESDEKIGHDENSAPMIIPPIAFGVPALRNQYPHMALLGYGDIDTAQWLCGGSIISEKFILTAAHCISSPSVGPVKYAAFGILKRSDPPKYWQIHNVKRVIPHPEYHPPHKYHDIALIETEDLIYFDKYYVRPACLDVKSEPDFYAEATGWGALGHNQDLADTLQTVTLRKFDTKTCSLLYPKHRHLRYGFDEATQLCYGAEDDPKDTCQGDSGGPLQVKNGQQCSYSILGVTSYGRQCGKTAGSGVYTRVYHYLPWIENILWP